MKLAFVFPGQGSQYVGMGQAIAQAYPAGRAALDEADAALGGGLLRLMYEGPEEELRKTANTQPAILAVSSAVHRVLMKEAGGSFQFPAFYAGHSLGEYSALVPAGAMSLQDGVRAVRARGTFMQDAVPAGEGAMAAILGLEPPRVKESGADPAPAADAGDGARALGRDHPADGAPRGRHFERARPGQGPDRPRTAHRQGLARPRSGGSGGPLHRFARGVQVTQGALAALL